ncbi:structural protein [Bacillus phage vB_BauM_KLEB27-3]|nr:structural protein [Bacillus phage vB_BauM_KLEB27-3]
MTRNPKNPAIGGGSKPNPTGITTSVSTLSLVEGTGSDILVNIEPSSADQNIVFTTSSASIASISEAGTSDGKKKFRVNGVSSGTATITFTSKQDSSIKKTVSVTVKKPAPTGITVDKEVLNLTTGESGDLNLNVTPANAVQEVSGSTADTSIARISPQGLVDGKIKYTVNSLKAGSTTITFSVKEDTSKKVTVTVNVTDPIAED